MSPDSSEKIWEKIQDGVFIIAEAGKNFIQTKEDRPIAEYLTNAKQLVDEAAKGGADAIKFQTHNVEDEVLNIDFTSPHFTAKGSDRYSWVTRNTNATPLNEFWKPLKAYCDRRGIIFMSTPMSRGAAEKLARVGVDLWKVGSGDILDFLTLDFICKTGKPILMSSGMSTEAELDLAISFVQNRTSNLAVLHCVSKYPCPVEDLNLGTIGFLKNKYAIPIGFSDHSLSTDSSVLAVALGATIIEKHFSFDRGFYGADHKVSLLPREFAKMVEEIRLLESSKTRKQALLNISSTWVAVGDTKKVLQKGEAVFRPVFRKSLVLSQDVPAGTVLESRHLYAMRPQSLISGLPSEKYEEVVGKRLTKSLKKYEAITQDILSN